MKNEINKFLTEQLGGCWHETIGPYSSGYGWVCKHCDRKFTTNNNFFTPEGFFKLWNWAIEQDWWHGQFEPWLLCDWKNNKQYGMVKSEIINPERFAKGVYELLEEHKNDNK